MSFAALLAAADRAAIGNLGGVTVRYTPTPIYGPGVDVVGIFQDPGVRTDVNGAIVATAGPSVFLRLEDLPSDPEIEDAKTMTVAVAGQTYRVRDAQKDGEGGVMLQLAEVEQ